MITKLEKTHRATIQNQGRVEQSVERPTADPGVVSLSPIRLHTFVEIDQEIISTVVLPMIQEGLLSVTSESMCTKYWLTV